MMKRILLTLTLAILATGCSYVTKTTERLRYGTSPYAEDPYWVRYMDTGSATDKRVIQTLVALRSNPGSAALHNDLGTLLVEKRLPKDAEREFRRSLDADPRFYPAAYNIALVRMNRGDFPGARRALHRTLRMKPGHPMAHFELGLLLEKSGRPDAAVEHYARAIAINRSILDVKENPKVLDSLLLDRALLKLYPTEHARRSAGFEATPGSYAAATVQRAPEAPSRQATPEEIVTPAPGVTDQGTQTPAPPTEPPQ